MDGFLPQNYEIPKSPSNYMKFVEGPNTFRVLTSAIIGYEYFDKDNKPVRSKEAFEETPTNIKQGGKIKPFWAFVVYNYQDKLIQILELTQKSIMSSMKANIDNPKWGSPLQYDITVTRTGEGLDTEYITQAEPPIATPTEEVVNAFMGKKINLEALYSGADPFAN